MYEEDVSEWIFFIYFILHRQVEFDRKFKSSFRKLPISLINIVYKT